MEMFEPTLFTWILTGFGIITCMPLLIAQLVILVQPKGQKAKDILIGKGEEWRNETHFKSALGSAWADWLFFFPIFVTGIIGMSTGESWGYLLFAVSGALSVYINIILWFQEKEYVYPSRGPLQYYTYYWGNFIYWGVAALLYGIYRIV
jgi:hypothetical protein